MKRSWVPIIVVLTLALGMGGAKGAVNPGGGAVRQAKIHSEVQEHLGRLKPGEMMTVIITVQDDSVLRPDPRSSPLDTAEMIGQLRARAISSQGQILSSLKSRQAEGSAGNIVPFWIFNGLSVTARAEVILELADHPEVTSILPDRIFEAPSVDAFNSDEGNSTAAFNLIAVHAPALWERGFLGQNVVIASLDTGVSIDHPALASAWRGGTNSWYDPYGEHPDKPTDINGHGTWTMGVMAARATTDRTVGIAPEAKWISAKIFNDQNQARTTAIHQAFQWLLDPDGNPATDDAPDVVNNSWSYQTAGCYLDFQTDLQVLRAAGILPVFSAGNVGPDERTSVSPSNYPEAFAVGAVDSDGIISPVSSRGYSSCGEKPTTYPELVAPGVNIRSTGLFGSYAHASGTSLAAPHATGSLALLLSAYPDLTVEQQEAVLMEAAYDLGDPGPDNQYGYGELDVFAAYRSLASQKGEFEIRVRSFLPIAAGGW